MKITVIEVLKMLMCPVEVIPRKFTNPPYGRMCNPKEVEVALKHNDIVWASQFRITGHYPHMMEKTEPCGYCEWASDKDTHLGSISNYCPNCGRRLTNG